MRDVRNICIMDIIKFVLCLLLLVSTSYGNHLQTRRPLLRSLARSRATTTPRRTNSSIRRPSSVNVRRQTSSVSQASANARRQLLQILAKRRRNEALIARQRLQSRRQIQLLRNRLLQTRRNQAALMRQRFFSNMNRRPIEFHGGQNDRSSLHNSDIGTGDIFANPVPTSKPSFRNDPFVPLASVNQGIPVATIGQDIINSGIIVPQIAFIPPNLLVSQQPIQLLPNEAAPTNPPIREISPVDKALEMFLMEELGIDPPDPPETPSRKEVKRTKPKSKPKQRKTTIIQTHISKFTPTTPIRTTQVPPTTPMSELSRIALASTQSPLRIILSTNDRVSVPPSLQPPVMKTKPPVVNKNEHIVITPGGNFTIQLGKDSSIPQNTGVRIVKR